MQEETMQKETKELDNLTRLVEQISKLTPQEQEKVGFFIQGYTAGVSERRKGCSRGKGNEPNYKNAK